jgi:hypothetical protein
MIRILNFTKLLVAVGVSLFVAEPAHPLHGRRSLQVTFPASGGVVEFRQVPENWLMRDDPSPSQGTPWKDEVLLLFVWSMEPAEITLALLDSKQGSC